MANVTKQTVGIYDIIMGHELINSLLINSEIRRPPSTNTNQAANVGLAGPKPLSHFGYLKKSHLQMAVVFCVPDASDHVNQ